MPALGLSQSDNLLEHGFARESIHHVAKIGGGYGLCSKVKQCLDEPKPNRGLGKAQRK